MKGLWSVLSILAVVTVLVFAPGLGTAQTDQMSGGKAPIAQPLVREGDFAVRLAGALNLGSPTGEIDAESILSAAGISPRNGWIADYPVTPDIAGELRASVAVAGGNGAISAGSDGGVRIFDSLMSEYNLAVMPDASDQTANGASGTIYPDDAAMNNYYSEDGPPIVTYYAPPYDYAYLYSWVPYPFWWWDVWFPGYFILADFDRVVFFDRDHDRHREHARDHDRDREHFSNHFFDHNTVSRVDPSHRADNKSFVARSVAGGSAAGRSVRTGGAKEVRNPLVSPWERGSVTPLSGQGVVAPSKTSPVFRGRGDRSNYRTGNSFSSQGMGGHFTNTLPHSGSSWSRGQVDGGLRSHPSVNRSFSSFGGRQWR